MFIDHVAIYVNDLEAAKDFFIKYFAAVSGEIYRNEKTGFSSYFLGFENGAKLEIMNRPEIEKTEKPFYKSGYAHLAFSLGSKSAVDELTKKLENDGFEITSGPRTTGDGFYESAFIGIEGNIIELTV
ncbi:MAG: VOC family protein [Oscillospiraceae bacterium]|nr:VOC family protein [Oscillospiraceae bacterium]